MAEGSVEPKAPNTYNYNSILDLQKKFSDLSNKFSEKRPYKSPDEEKPGGVNRRSFIKMLGIGTAAVFTGIGVGAKVATEVGKNSTTPEKFLRFIRDRAEGLYREATDQKSMYDKFQKFVEDLDKGFQIPDGYEAKMRTTFRDNNEFYVPGILITGSGIRTAAGAPLNIFKDSLARENFLQKVEINITEPIKDLPANLDPTLLSPLADIEKLKRYSKMTAYILDFLLPVNNPRLAKSKIVGYLFQDNVTNPGASLGRYEIDGQMGYLLEDGVLKIEDLAEEKYRAAEAILH